jgi:hypothetical protein
MVSFFPLLKWLELVTLVDDLVLQLFFLLSLRLTHYERRSQFVLDRQISLTTNILSSSLSAMVRVSKVLGGKGAFSRDINAVMSPPLECLEASWI